MYRLDLFSSPLDPPLNLTCALLLTAFSFLPFWETASEIPPLSPQPFAYSFPLPFYLLRASAHTPFERVRVRYLDRRF